MSESTIEVIQKNNDVLAMTKEVVAHELKLHAVLKRHLKEKNCKHCRICKSCHSKDYLHTPDKLYSRFDLKSVVTTMNKTIKSTRNEQSANTKLSHYPSNETDRIFLGFVDSGKTKVGTPLKYIPVTELKLDSNNVRFRHIGINLTDEQIEELIWSDPDTIKLYKDIQNTLGIIEPLYVDSNNIVIEGNRRLVCLRRICREIRNDVIRNIPLAYIDPIPCRVIPVEVNQVVKDEFLARIHIGGKKEWRSLDQASHLYELHHAHQLPVFSNPRLSEVLYKNLDRKKHKNLSATIDLHHNF
jgi:hypothetical protein